MQRKIFPQSGMSTPATVSYTHLDVYKRQSYANEAKHGVRHNERLEFLGDSVLSIVVAEYLFTHKNMPEGELTRMRASLVCEAALFEFAKQISLGDYLRLGRGEERGGGRCRPSILSDAFEAVIAALYLDGGMETARAFILPFVTGALTDAAAEEDYKTCLLYTSRCV